MQRAVSNGFVIDVNNEINKIMMVGNLGDAYDEVGRHSEAQTQFKRIIDSGLIPADQYRFLLAKSYHKSRKCYEAAEAIVPLYCKRVFDVDTEHLYLFKDQNGMCFREAVYRLVAQVSYHFWMQGSACEKRGDDLAFNQKLPGTSLSTTSPIPRTNLAHIHYVQTRPTNSTS